MTRRCSCSIVVPLVVRRITGAVTDCSPRSGPLWEAGLPAGRAGCLSGPLTVLACGSRMPPRYASQPRFRGPYRWTLACPPREGLTIQPSGGNPAGRSDPLRLLRRPFSNPEPTTTCACAVGWRPESTSRAGIRRIAPDGRFDPCGVRETRWIAPAPRHHAMKQMRAVTTSCGLPPGAARCDLVERRSGRVDLADPGLCGMGPGRPSMGRFLSMRPPRFPPHGRSRVAALDTCGNSLGPGLCLVFGSAGPFCRRHQ
jgi:hypothetical protein